MDINIRLILEESKPVKVETTKEESPDWNWTNHPFLVGWFIKNIRYIEKPYRNPAGNKGTFNDVLKDIWHQQKLSLYDWINNNGNPEILETIVDLLDTTKERILQDMKNGLRNRARK